MAAVMTATEKAPPTATKMIASSPDKHSATGHFSFGKYREIIIAVALFLLFDMGVLVLNFYTSFQIAEDAVGINLAGRQRMLSQRTAKALLTVETAQLKGLPQGQALDELKLATNLFDQTLKGFQNGATVPGGAGKPVFLPAADGPLAAEILVKAQALWTPYQAVLNPVLRGNASDVELQTAVDYAKANNLKLLGLMNELTTALEGVASQRATNLRMVQTVGIVLALLNFAFILFKFLRRLRTSDAEIEAVIQENREILTSVREGLFLITPDMQLGSQLSKSAHTLFGSPLQPGKNFFDVLQPLLSAQLLGQARDYVDLLFSPHVKEQLVQGINPLSSVEATVKNRLGQDTTRHLSFHFNRVQGAGKVRHLLVTVQDISEKVELEGRLQSERLRSQKEFSMLLKAFETDPTVMQSFVKRSESSLLEINDLLRSTSSVSSETQVLKIVDGAFRRIHAIKGDAASLGLDVLAGLAHQFETELQKLKGSGQATGDALLSLPLPLEDLLGKVGALKAIGARKASGGESAAPSMSAHPDSLNAALTKLAADVSRDCHKTVSASIRMRSVVDLPADKADQIRDIAIQLVRNAVVHGVENASERLALGKTPEGQLHVNLTHEATGEWQLSVRDDGAGLDANRIRRKLLDLGWYVPEQLECLSDKQVIAHIFKPGFSTASFAVESLQGQHAGRGVGLDVVQTHVQTMGARLLISTVVGQFTEFKVRFSS